MSDPTPPSQPPELRNTLYRKVTRGNRRLSRGRLLLYRVAVVVAWTLVRFFWATCRVQRTLGLERARAAVRESHSVIPVYWHQHMLFGVRALLDLRDAGLKLGFLISPSVDGELPAMLVRRAGGHVIRGSSSATGARALRDYYEAIARSGISPAITPDGPHGPRREFKPGAVLLAQLSGKPIVPMAYAARYVWHFPTWDRFVLPLPFTRTTLAIGEPRLVPKGLDSAALQRWQDTMRAELETLEETARAAN